MKKQAVLLVNLGSPDSPAAPDVRRYLREFLMDGRVIDAPWPIRFGIVHFAILPKRPHASAEAYRSIWTKDGSPLVVNSRLVQAALQAQTDLPVELAMRYQNPSIQSAIERLAEQEVEELLLIPLFPHYAMSSYETAVVRVQELAMQIAPAMRVQVQAPYYDSPDYINALTASAADYLDEPFDHLLFSFHGLPERHLKKSDKSCTHCMKVSHCCETPSPAQDTCYRAQCLKTMRAFAQETGIAEGKHSVAFQSRLGRDPWMSPYTDKEIERLAKAGIKRLLVICPAFVSDCLETIEEIGMRGAESFKQAGGDAITLIPCLNDHPQWIRALAGMVEQFTSGPAASRETLNGITSAANFAESH